jgi:tRNA pseudouridine(38-40) synthase
MAKWVETVARKSRIDVIASVAYDGSSFFGWQQQPDCAARTIEGRLVAAIKQVCGEAVGITAVSRTDSQVSAKCQLIRFGMSGAAFAAVTPDGDASRLQRALNDRLAEPERLIQINRMRFLRPSQIRLRQTALVKQYSYYVMLLPQNDRAAHTAAWKLQMKRVFKYAGRFDADTVPRMRAALQDLVGTHDFRLLGLERTLSPSSVTARAAKAGSAGSGGSDADTRGAELAGAGDALLEGAGAAPDCAGSTAGSAAAGAGGCLARPLLDDGEDALSVGSADSDDEGEADDAGTAGCGGISSGSAAAGGAWKRDWIPGTSTTVRALQLAELQLLPPHLINNDLGEGTTPETEEGIAAAALAAAAAAAAVSSGAPGAGAGPESAAATAASFSGAASAADAVASASSSWRPQVLRFRFVGEGFLRHQVRLMVGVALQIGCGQVPPSGLRMLLEAGRLEAEAEQAATAAATAVGVSSLQEEEVADTPRAAAPLAKRPRLDDGCSPSVPDSSSSSGNGAAAGPPAPARPAAKEPKKLASSLRARNLLGVKNILKVPGYGLLLERITVPPELWNDEDFTNTKNRGYLAEYGLTMHDNGNHYREYKLRPATAAEGAAPATAGAGAAAAAVAAIEGAGLASGDSSVGLEVPPGFGRAAPMCDAESSAAVAQQPIAL